MMEGRWDSAPPYALIIHSGDFDNKVCIPEKGAFSRYLVEPYRYRAKANWFDCGSNCCLDRPSTTTTTPPPRCTLPDNFQAKMVGHGPDSWAPFFLNWCDFHDHESEGKREACQYYRLQHKRENICSLSENWYFEYMEEADPDATTIML